MLAQYLGDGKVVQTQRVYRGSKHSQIADFTTGKKLTSTLLFTRNTIVVLGLGLGLGLLTDLLFQKTIVMFSLKHVVCPHQRPWSAHSDVRGSHVDGGRVGKNGQGLVCVPDQALEELVESVVYVVY